MKIHVNLAKMVTFFVRRIVYNVLHLVSFDHKKDKDYKKMLKEEELIYKSVISKIKLN